MAIENERTSTMESYLLSLPGDRLRLAAKLGAWVTFCLFFLLLCHVIIFLALVGVRSQYIYFFSEIILYLGSYWGTALLGAYMMGMTVALFTSSKWIQSAGLLTIWLLSSPFPTQWFDDEEAPSYLMSVLHWLRRTERDLNVDYPEYSGIPLSSLLLWKHGSYLLFMLAVLAVFVAIANPRWYAPKTRWIYAALGGGFLIALAIALPYSRSILDQSYTSSYSSLRLDEDKQFYRQLDTQRVEQGPVLIAQKYNVDHQRRGEQIEYRASIQLKREPSPSDWYDFTLFNGWNVSAIKLNGHPVAWDRSGDWIRIHFPASTSVAYDEISICVHGYGGAKSLSGSNCFYLVETFPWLPVPGKHAVATVFPSNYNRVLLPEEVEYTVHISSAPRYPVYSNLARTGTDTFSGRAQGVMLASSLLLEVRDQQFTVLTLPDRQDQLLALLPQFRKKSTDMAQWLGVQAPELPSTIIMAPSYSTWYTDVIDVGRDVLALDSKTASRQPHQLFDERALFYALYWNGVIPKSYEEETHIDGMLLYALIREIYEREIYEGGTSLLHDYANPDPDSDTIDLDILYQRAYMLAQWLQNAKPGEAEKLIRNVYHSLLHNQDRTHRWEKAMKEVAQHAATAPTAS